MSSRFLKKVEKTYGNKVDITENNLESESSEEESVPNFSNKFDILKIESDSVDESDDTEILTKEAKIHKKVEMNKSSKSKKSKAKKQTTSNFNDMTEDEIFEQFNKIETTQKVEGENINCGDALSIRMRNLNENVELQQMFGPSAAGTSVNVNDRNRRINHLSTLKCTFGKRGQNWPQVSLSKLGLKMERIDNINSEYNWCKVTCSEEYLSGERALKSVMRTGDYQDHLRQWPYHINTLLQMASLLINQEDFTMAADILKRVFYVFETISPMGLSLLGFSVGGSLSHCTCALDYRYRLNRGIFIALFQWIHYLCQRSCFTTALEYCKVILNLNVVNDPLAIILMIDDIALRGNQFDFLIQFHTQFNSSKSLTLLPNFAFSVALCHFLKSSGDKCKKPDFTQADSLLQNALCRFPSFLTTIVDNCNIKTDDRVARCSFFSSVNDSLPLSVLLKLYMKRSMNLWKNVAVLRWLETNVQRLLDRFETDQAVIEADRRQVCELYKRAVIPLAIKRHIFLSGHGELLAAQNDNGGSTTLIFDPFPPANSDGGFDHYLDSDSPTELDDSWLVNLFRSLLPSFR